MKKLFRVLKWTGLGLLCLPLAYCGLVIHASPALIHLDRTLPYRLDELDAISIDKLDFDFGFIQEHNWTILGTLNADIPEFWVYSDEKQFYSYEIDEFRKEFPEVKPEEVAIYRLPGRPDLHALILVHHRTRKVKITMWR
jgi:hypothetical protein